jgi:hypothetical protein
LLEQRAEARGGGGMTKLVGTAEGGLSFHRMLAFREH